MRCSSPRAFRTGDYKASVEHTGLPLALCGGTASAYSTNLQCADEAQSTSAIRCGEQAVHHRTRRRVDVQLNIQLDATLPVCDGDSLRLCRSPRRVVEGQAPRTSLATEDRDVMDQKSEAC
jgi:hypothetical protein